MYDLNSEYITGGVVVHYYQGIVEVSTGVVAPLPPLLLV